MAQWRLFYLLVYPLRGKFFGFFVVKGCLNGFQRCFWLKNAWSFSMLSALGFLGVVSPVEWRYNVCNVDGAEYLE